MTDSEFLDDLATRLGHWTKSDRGRIKGMGSPFYRRGANNAKKKPSKRHDKANLEKTRLYLVEKVTTRIARRPRVHDPALDWTT